MPITSLKSKIDRTLELVQLWKQYHDLYGKAAKGGPFQPEDESRFLDLKSNIARRYQALVELAGPKDLPDPHSMDVVAQITSLDKVAALSDLEKDKIEADWNATFVTLNRFLGGLEAGRDTAKSGSAGLENFKKLIFSPGLVLVYMVVLIVLAYLFWFEWMAPKS